MTHSCTHTCLLQCHHLEITTKQGSRLLWRRSTNWKKMQIVFLKVTHEPPARSSGFLPMTHLTDQKAQLWPDELPALSSPGAETEVLGQSAGPTHTRHLGGEKAAPSGHPLTALTPLEPDPRDSDPHATRPPRCIQDSTVSLHPLASWPDSRCFPQSTCTGLSPHRLLDNKPGPRGQGSACETGKCGTT